MKRSGMHVSLHAFVRLEVSPHGAAQIQPLATDAEGPVPTDLGIAAEPPVGVRRRYVGRPLPALQGPAQLCGLLSQSDLQGIHISRDTLYPQ